MAIINSGLLKTNSKITDVHELIDFLIKTFKSKVYLRIPAMEVILALLEEIKDLEFGNEGISYAILKCVTDGGNIEEIWMVAVLQSLEVGLIFLNLKDSI